jgi:hypothetical protein
LIKKIIYALRRVRRLSNDPGAGIYSYILLHNFPKLCLIPSSGTIIVPSIMGPFCEATGRMTLNKPNGIKFANGFSFPLQSDERNTVRFETLRILIKKREQKYTACSHALACKVFGLQRHLNYLFFYVRFSVHHKSMNLEDQRDAVLSSLYLFYCQVTLNVSGVCRTHHQEYTKCSYNNWYKSYCKLQRYHLDENCGLENWFRLLTCNFCACSSGFF